MTILKHEVRSGLAGCILWSAVTGGLMALCVSMYPSMSGSMDDFSAMFANMGDFSAAFGLDKLEFGSVMGFNKNQNIAVITPEINNGVMVLRDNFLPFVKGKRVLLLTASATTGKDVRSVVEGITYYGGEAVGAATVFGGEFECRVPVVKIFGLEDIPDYSSYAAADCPLCKRGVKVDALVNSYGYSKII